MPQCNTLRKWRSQAIWKASLEPVYNILIVLVCRLYQGIYWNNVLFCRMKRRNLVMLVSSLMSSLIVHYLRYAYFSSNYFNEVIWKFIHWNQLDFCPLPPPLRNWHLCHLLLANNKFLLSSELWYFVLIFFGRVLGTPKISLWFIRLFQKWKHILVSQLIEQHIRRQLMLF